VAGPVPHFELFLSDTLAPPRTTPLSGASVGGRRAPRPGSLALNGLLLIAMLTVLHLAREFVLPVVAALILALVFLPAVRGMKALWIPAPLGAAIIVLGLVAATSLGVYTLADPARQWLDKAPQGLRHIGEKLRGFTGQVNEVSKATAHVRQMTQDMAGGDPAAQDREVTVRAPNLVGIVLESARVFSLGAMSTLLLLYFLLASGDLFLRKTIAATPRLADKQRASDIATQVEAAVSRYLFAVTLINLALGAAVALALHLMGVPNPLLWGVGVALLNFVPYLGEVVIIGALTIVGLLTFDEVWRGLLVPGVFVVLSIAERYVLTPLVVGRRLSLNPVVIVLSVLFWGAMWGIPGALLAVPILVTIKVLSDRVERLKVFGDFLGA
jgi:predicted PurR-regulated permease PerM